MEIKTVKISKLIPHPKNPRIHPDSAIEKLTKSIKEFGWTNPILVSKDNFILAGHARLKAAERAGLKEVPVIYLPFEGSKAEAYMIADNKIQDETEWDFPKLKDLLQELDTGEFDIEITGFDENEIEDLMTQFYVPEENEKDDEVPEVEEPVTKLGDLYKLGEHRLLCGDSTKIESFNILMGDNKAKLCFTSPPYNMAGNLYKNYTDNLKSREYIDFNLTVIHNVKKFLEGFIFWNMSYNKNARWEWIEIFYRIIRETGLSFIENVIWDKGHGLPITSKEGLTRQYENILVVGTEADIYEDLEYCFLGNNQKSYYFNKKTLRGLTNYWRITTGNTQTEINKACFPVALVVNAILLMTLRDDIILDPFLGSGSTLIGCEKTGRICYGIELDELSCDIAIKRWEDYTGKKAELL